MHATRRDMLQGALAGAAAALMPSALSAEVPAPLSRAIPSSREAMPLVGLGTWITFNVGNDRELHLLRHFGYADRIRYYWNSR